MKKNRRLKFTLLEVLIALALATVILSTLLYFYFQMSQASIVADRAAVESFKIRFLENRLRDLTLRMVEPNNEDHVFFSGNSNFGLFLPNTDNLVFTYDNGKVLSDSLSSYVLGRLYVDPEKRLTLMTWQDRSKWKDNVLPPFHREVLFDNVEKFGIDFFVGPKSDEEQSLTPREELRLPKWFKPWGKDFQELPALLKFTITTEGGDIVYVFPLANKNAKVIYKS